VARSGCHKPLIGVTGPDRGGWAAWFFTRLALWRCGASARRITPSTGAAVRAPSLCGLVIGGGADVTEPLSELLEDDEGDVDDPQRSRERGERPRWVHLLLAPFILAVRWLGSRRGHGVDAARDRLELRLLREAEQAQLPVLGVCRGAQLMSLAMGGQLLRHVDELYEERPKLYTALPRREIQIEPSSVLRRVLGSPALLVNSLHHHAIENVGPGLRVVAREPHGVVQAVERAEPVLWWGVQWHPEYLPQSPAQMRLLRHWVAECRIRCLREPAP
jgi:putative glutamine amidotransferase